MIRKMIRIVSLGLVGKSPKNRLREAQTERAKEDTKLLEAQTQRAVEEAKLLKTQRKR